MCCTEIFFFFFFNDTATTEIYTLSLHDALPISSARWPGCSPSRSWCCRWAGCCCAGCPGGWPGRARRPPPCGCCAAHRRSEEHTSELQSRQYLVCRLLLEKKKNYTHYTLLSYTL